MSSAIISKRFNERKLKAVLLTIVVLSFLAACQPQTDEIILSGPIMGTDYRINIRVDQMDVSKAELENRILDAMQAVNQSMSTYIEFSELSAINRLPSGESVLLSDDLNSVLTESLYLSELSNGAFDVTLGKAIRLWGFSEDGKITQRPSSETILALKGSVGYRYLDLQNSKLTKLSDGLEINVSAIAKGYAVDKVAQVIEAQGIEHYLVNIGGELRAKGRNSEGKLWRIGVEKPHLLGGVAQVVLLDSMAIATSGDYRNFIVLDGQQFSHTIDSQTLKPVYHKLASVSVLASRASTADGLATALMAMGEIAGLEFANKHQIAAYFIIRGEQDEHYTVQMTEQFRLNLPE